jgi:hypothetical protein
VHLSLSLGCSIWTGVWGCQRTSSTNAISQRLAAACTVQAVHKCFVIRAGSTLRYSQVPFPPVPRRLLFPFSFVPFQPSSRPLRSPFSLRLRFARSPTPTLRSCSNAAASKTAASSDAALQYWIDIQPPRHPLPRQCFPLRCGQICIMPFCSGPW